MKDCLFCQIASGNLACEKLYEDDQLCAFNDIDGQAPVHILIIPKRHICTLDEVGPDDRLLLGSMLELATQLARKLGLSRSGYRTVMNCQEGGGQSIFHIHLHLLGGRDMQWPPG